MMHVTSLSIYAQFALHHLKQEGVTPTAIKALILLRFYSNNTSRPTRKETAGETSLLRLTQTVVDCLLFPLLTHKQLLAFEYFFTLLDYMIYDA